MCLCMNIDGKVADVLQFRFGQNREEEVARRFPLRSLGKSLCLGAWRFRSFVVAAHRKKGGRR